MKVRALTNGDSVVMITAGQYYDVIQYDPDNAYPFQVKDDTEAIMWLRDYDAQIIAEDVPELLSADKSLFAITLANAMIESWTVHDLKQWAFDQLSEEYLKLELPALVSLSIAMLTQQAKACQAKACATARQEPTTDTRSTIEHG